MVLRLSKWIYTLIIITYFNLLVALGYQINTSFSQTNINENKKIINFFVLGDSLADPGNLIGLIKQTANKMNGFTNSWLCPLFIKKLCQTYQTDILPSQYYKNRFTNSLVFTEIVASKLNIESKPAWNVFTFISTNFLCKWIKTLVLKFNRNTAYGNNYALANAKSTNDIKLYQDSIKQIKIQIWRTIFFRSSYQQLEQLAEQFEMVIDNFLSLNNQTETLLQQHQIKENDLFFICITGNDIIDIEDITNQQQVDQAIDQALDGLNQAIKKLISKQAKRIIISNVVDISKIPARLNYFSVNYSNACCLYNEKWDKMINSLQERHPLILIQKFNINKLFIHYLNAYEQQGKNITNSVVSYGEHDFFAMLTGEKVEDSYNIDICEYENYFFFDKIHPIKEVHEVLAEELFKFINDN